MELRGWVFAQCVQGPGLNFLYQTPKTKYRVMHLVFLLTFSFSFHQKGIFVVVGFIFSQVNL